MNMVIKQAKDISDADMLASVARHERGEGGWAMTWDIEPDFPGFPPKVVLAKLRKLLKRGLIDGCGCGCRGDWEIVEQIKV